MRKTSIGFVVLFTAILAVGCSGGGDDDDDDDGSSGDLTVPVTTTMTIPIGGVSYAANVCQTLAIGGGVNFNLYGGIDCVGGENYLVFAKDSSASFKVTAGMVLDPVNAPVPVDIVSTSVSTVTQEAGSGADTVLSLSSAMNITIGTTGHSTITFSFLGTDVTITAFE